MGQKYRFGNTHGCLSSTQLVCPCLFWRDGRKLHWTYWLMLTYRHGTVKWSVACLFLMKPSSSRRSHYQDTTLKMLCFGRGLKMENTPANSDIGSWSMRLMGKEWRKRKLMRKKFWHSIWDSWIPNKIKIFLWRTCHDSIPTKTNLMRWHITENPLCEWCLWEEESPIHALWSCIGLDSVWSSPEWSFRPNIKNTNFKELLSWILKYQSNPELFVMIT